MTQPEAPLVARTQNNTNLAFPGETKVNIGPLAAKSIDEILEDVN